MMQIRSKPQINMKTNIFFMADIQYISKYMFIQIFQKWRCVFLTQNKLQILSSHDLVPNFLAQKMILYSQLKVKNV